MSREISEALLEMHFHKPLVEFFEHLHGAKAIKLFKPTAQKENWVGFDQAWTRSNLTQEKLFEELKDAIKNEEKEAKEFYLGYFLQFKTVKKLERSSTRKPKNFKTPYYRTELSLEPNKHTGLSQHETLMRLKNLKNALVCYACGMIFDSSEVFEEPSLEKLQFVDLELAPTGFKSHEKHAINFRTIDDPKPFWCSEPVEGRAFSVEMLKEYNYAKLMKRLTSQEATELIKDTLELLFSPSVEKDDLQIVFWKNRPQIMPSSFTLLKMRK